MASGGFRPNAGRPKSAKVLKEKAKKLPADIKKAAKKAKLTPLAYMLMVLNDTGAVSERRDRMAIAAAPFVHPRPESAPSGKKDAAAQAAKTAGAGTTWGDDLAQS